MCSFCAKKKQKKTKKKQKKKQQLRFDENTVILLFHTYTLFFIRRFHYIKEYYRTCTLQKIFGAVYEIIKLLIIIFKMDFTNKISKEMGVAPFEVYIVGEKGIGKMGTTQ